MNDAPRHFAIEITIGLALEKTGFSVPACPCRHKSCVTLGCASVPGALVVTRYCPTCQHGVI